MEKISEVHAVANMARAGFEATRDLYWCSRCGIARRITEGFVRDPDLPSTFYARF